MIRGVLIQFQNEYATEVIKGEKRKKLLYGRVF